MPIPPDASYISGPLQPHLLYMLLCWCSDLGIRFDWEYYYIPRYPHIAESMQLAVHQAPWVESISTAVVSGIQRHAQYMRTLRQKRRSSTKLGSKNCVTIFGAEFGSAAAEYGPIRKKLWRQPSSFKQYFQTKLCTKKMWQNRLRFGRDVNSERVLNWTEKPCPFYKQTWVCTNIYKIDRLVTV